VFGTVDSGGLKKTASLYCLAHAHLISKDPTASVMIKLPQPSNAFTLVWAKMLIQTPR
jgi:hypothetical protein